MQLEAKLREKGKKPQDMRAAGFIPAEVYGRGIENIHVTVPVKEFNRLYIQAGGTTVINLLVDKTEHSVLVHDVQKDFIKGDIVHVDFYQIQKGQKITAHIPVEFIGESPAVKSLGGVLMKAMDEIEVEGPAEHLPHSFAVSLEGLDELDKSFHVKDLETPAGVEILADPDAVIVSVAPSKVEEETPVATVDVTEVKVESEEKKAEREAKKAQEEAA